MGRIEGKRAVVTGAGSGVGEATARRFAAEGARVAVLDVDEDKAARVVSEIESAGGVALAVRCDVADEADVTAAVDAAVDAWGGLDVVVANAGVQLFGQDARAHELDLDVWERTQNVNMRGIFLTCKHGLRALLASGGGSVICTGSPTGYYGKAPGFTAYSSSKAGVWGLVRVMAADYAADDIRVNSVVPGFTATPLVQTIIDDPEWTGRLLENTPIKRPGTGEDVAAMMLFLASDESAYATGAAFVVDGGVMAI